MGLFSRRKKQDDDVTAAEAPAPAESASAQEGATEPDVAPGSEVPSVETAQVETPKVDISVQSFRGLGAPAGPATTVPEATGENPQKLPRGTERTLPLAPLEPPAPNESVPGMKDNVLLRAALAQLQEGASNEQLLGVLRQTLQGQLFLRVQGDAGQQIRDGKPLAVGIVKDGDNTYMLAFTSAASVRDSVQGQEDADKTSVVAQPVRDVLRQVVNGPFAGLIIDNASAPHRVVFPTEALAKALEQADPDFTLKTLLTAPREADSAAKVGTALATARYWVGVSKSGPDGQIGVAEARTPDGSRFLQLFSHPLEVSAVGRGERPLPFSGEQLGKVLLAQPELTGVMVDPAGPSILVRRDALGPVLAVAEAAQAAEGGSSGDAS